MIGSIALVLLGAAAGAATPCENLASLKLADATITSAVVVPEGPPPQRGAGGGGARGAAPQGAQQAAAVGLELERRPAVWTGRTRVEKGVDLLLEEVSLEGAEKLFGLGQA